MKKQGTSEVVRLCRRVVLPASLAVVLTSGAAVSRADTTVRASVSSSEVQDNSGASGASYITPNGRFVVFASTADGLVPGDTNSVSDVFVRDLVLGTTSRVSVPDPSTGFTQANGASRLGRPGVRYCSDDGRFVVFVSSASNLVNGDTNGDQDIEGLDIFVRDRDLDNNGILDEAGAGKVKTVRVSVDSNENQYTKFVVGVGTYGGRVDNPSISANGRYVAFECDHDGLTVGTDQGTIGSNIYWRDRDADNDGIFDEPGNNSQGVDQAITKLVSKVRCCTGQQFDGYSQNPAISGDGRYVAFASLSRFLDIDTVQDNDSNNVLDVYVRRMDGNYKAQRVSLDSSENQLTTSGANNPSISYDGRYVAFVTSSSQLLPSGQDTNNTSDVYVRDRGVPNGSDYLVTAGLTERVSLGVGFLNSARQLSGASTDPFISSDGRFVAFVTNDNSVLCGILGCADPYLHKDVYVRDRASGSEWTRLASTTATGEFPNGDSTFAAISDDGSMVSFASVATNIVGADANGTGSDVYVNYRYLTASAWRSVRTHAGAGQLPLFLSAAASGAATTSEPRQGGIQLVEVDFSTPAMLVFPDAVKVIGRTTTNGVMGPPVDYSHTAYPAMVDGDTLAITFIPPLPDNTCYNISISGAMANSTGPITGDTDVNIRSLVGDTNNNGVVNLGDALLIKPKFGQNVAGSPSMDVNLSGGTLNMADSLFVKSRVVSPANKALCP